MRSSVFFKFAALVLLITAGAWIISRGQTSLTNQPDHSDVSSVTSSRSVPPIQVSDVPLNALPVLDTRPVFLDGVALQGRESLKVEDLPYIDPYNAARWHDRLYVASIGSLAEFDTQRNLLRWSNPQVIPCSKDLQMYEVALTGDQLFVGCYNVGVFQIDLTRERVVGFYNQQNGLQSVQNLRLAAGSDGAIWVGTFEGLGAIDAKTGKVRFWKSELGTGCAGLSTTPHAAAGQVWISYTQSNLCKGGLVHWLGNDQWRAFGPEIFKIHQPQNIDFDNISISREGVVRALYRDDLSFSGGDDYHQVVAQYDPTTDTWKRTDEVVYDSPEAKVLLASFRDQQGGWVYSPYWHGNDMDANGLTHVREVVNGVTQTFEPSRYLSLAKDGSRLYALKSGGIDILEPDDTHFKPWVRDARIQNAAVFSFEPAQRKLVVVESAYNEMGGVLDYFSTMVIDADTKQITYYKTTAIPDDRQSVLFNEDLPTAKIVRHGQEFWLENNRASFVCFDANLASIRECIQKK